MDYIATLPVHVPALKGMLMVAEYEVRLTIEPDIVGWFVSGVEIAGTYGEGQFEWHLLPDNHAIASSSITLAYSTWRDTIDELWAQHKWDNPPLKRHRTPLRVISGGVTD